MSKKLLFSGCAFILLFVAGCSGQGVHYAAGESEQWKSEITYEIGEHEQIGKGFIEYTGNDQLDNLSYTIHYPASFGKGGDGNRNGLSEDEETRYSLTVSLPDTLGTDRILAELGDISITITWETVDGERMEETVNYSVQ